MTYANEESGNKRYPL